MTGVARHDHPAAELPRVDVDHHSHHFAGDEFRLLVVAVPNPSSCERPRFRWIWRDADVAVVAAYAERVGDRVHHEKELRLGDCGQNLQLRAVGRCGWLARLLDSHGEHRAQSLDQQELHHAIGIGKRCAVQMSAELKEFVTASADDRSVLGNRWPKPDASSPNLLI
jgi:hypothetical protein